jgi:hypothetical protein
MEMSFQLGKIPIWIAFVLISSAHPAGAGTPTCWLSGLSAYNGGAQFGVLPTSRDGWDGQAPGDPYWLPYVTGVGLVLYRQHDAGWAGDTGFYPSDYESPIPWGGSKTWWDFCLWYHNYTPTTPGQIQMRNGVDPEGDGPPAGYIGHIVIDQIPAGVTWNGPMDYWFDMTVRNNTFLMPIAEVTDPLQGTRFHLTVYTPEPSSLLALAAGMGSLGLVARKRRR